ncbi:MAG: CBS domain-containing protein [Rickettsiales bacterium]|nr:CBS domain-containing protein [Rickettsiales bacterium]
MNTDDSPDPRTSFFNNLKKLLSHFNRSKSNKSFSNKIVDAVSALDDLGDQEQKNIILNVAHLVDDQVADIMTPRTDIIAANILTEIQDLKALMIKSNHMRVPLFSESLDDIKGFVHMKDIFEKYDLNDKVALEKLMRPILFVPPSMKIVDLLVKMRTKKINIAIVVDEYGGTDGLITLEDLFEQVFGNIEENEIEAINEKMFEVNARIKIEELEEKFDISLLSSNNKEEFDTLAGYLMSLFKKIPKEGEVFEHDSGIKFHIKEANPRFIKTVVIEL